jgi:hypothetical protein
MLRSSLAWLDKLNALPWRTKVGNDGEALTSNFFNSLLGFTTIKPVGGRPLRTQITLSKVVVKGVVSRGNPHVMISIEFFLTKEDRVPLQHNQPFGCFYPSNGST